MKMKRFEIGVYNQTVRDALADGKHHRNLRDDWAEVHYIEIEAADEFTARRKVQTKYPEAQGYVIDDVHLIPED